MSKNKKIFIILFVISLFSFFLKGYLSSKINIRDILVQLEWAKTIYQNGLKNSYFYPTWTYSPPTQPPLMMLSFWLSQHIYENRYLLSEMHNSIKIPPTFFILWFDKFGEVFLIRIWAILGDLIAAIIIFKIVSRYLKNKRLAILAFLITILNPITIFESGIWGQNDIFSAIFIYLSFYILNSKPIRFIFSPPLFVLGILCKPVSLILLPFYGFYYFYRLIKSKKIPIIAKLFDLFMSVIISFSIISILFIPFINNQSNYLAEVQNIVINRIAPQSKGISRASNSAFNFYSLLYRIDYTSGSQKLFGLTLDNLGLIIFVLINLFSIYLLLSRSRVNSNKRTLLLTFIIFYISQASFLFLTGMLERYFFPGFIASIILIFILFKQLGWHLIIQQTIWFINLTYSFYQRDYGSIKNVFENNNYFLIRALSLLGVINLFLITKKFLQISSQKK